MEEEIVEFTLTGTSSTLEVVLETPFQIIAQSAEVGLKNVSFYNSIPNLDTHNNCISIKLTNTEYQDYFFTPGAYEVSKTDKSGRFPLIYR